MTKQLDLISTPATTEQILAALKILVNAMQLRRGLDGESVLVGYVTALEGMTLQEITSGIRRIIRGEIDGLDKRYCPSPPELAEALRGTARDRMKAFDRVKTGRLYRYRAPTSKIIARRCTKDFAASLVRNGAAPHGSIWCPGKLDEEPHIGDLYGPDDTWKLPIPLSHQPEKPT